MEGKNLIFLVVLFLMIITILGVGVTEDVLVEKFPQLNGLSENIAKYVFGFNETTMIAGENLTPYAIIVTFLMIWLIIFVSLGDVFETFSAFDTTISWLIALGLAVIGGLMGMINGILVWVTKWFAWAGTFAVFLALGISFVFFLAVKLGASSFLGRIKAMRTMRRAMRMQEQMDRAARGAKSLAKFEKEMEKEI